MSKVSDKHLSILIEGLGEYKKKGVIDPWVLEDGTIIEPLDTLVELLVLRKKSQITYDKGYEAGYWAYRDELKELLGTKDREDSFFVKGEIKRQMKGM